MQITWAEIEAEAGGFRQGLVALFKKYEGLETDERDGSNRVVKVTMSSFARHMGVPETTFNRWVMMEVSPDRVATSHGTTFNQRVEEAAAKAKAEAEAAAQQQLAKALAEQAQIANQAKLNARLQYEKELAAQKEQMRLEKLEALARLEKQLKDEAKNQGFDLTQLSDSDKAKVMSLIGNDPAQAKEWFRAYDAERARKNDEAMRKAQEEAERRKQSALDKEAKEAARKASLAYDDSPLHFYLTKLYPQLLKFEEMMKDKPITFDTIVYSRLAPSQIVPKFDRGEDIICAGREAIFQAQVQNELAEIFEED